MATRSRLSTCLLVCMVVHTLVGKNYAAVVEQFTTSYIGVSTSVGSHAEWRIKGLRPTDQSGLPVYVWITGWTNSFFADADMTLLKEMAKRGFIAAQVAYEHFGWTGDVCAPLDTMDRLAPTKNFNSVSARTKAKSLVSAIDTLCAREEADCSMGVAVHGFSMGSWLAALLPMYDSRITALLLFGYGIEKEPQDCLSDTSVSVYIEKNRRRVVNGVNDECFTYGHDMAAQMQRLSGYSNCKGSDCLQTDGSGYYFVAPEDYTMGENHSNVATHLFFRSGHTSETTLFPSFLKQSSSWALKSNFDWLAKVALDNDSRSLAAEQQRANCERFSTTYIGTGDVLGLSVPWRIEGLRPKDQNRLPVYLWITGWTNSFFADADMTLLLEMAKRGFVAAQVAYEHLGWTGDVCAGLQSMDRFAPSKHFKSVSARTKAKSLVNAVDELCATNGADCSKGVAVHGFSMGSWLAALLPVYDNRITALLLFGYGIEKEPQDCLSDTSVSVHIEKSRRRVVNGVNDECFTNGHDMIAQLQSMSGYSDCSSHRHCLQSDGSGYVLVTPFDYVRGENHSNVGTHLFFRSGHTPDSYLFPSFMEQSSAWTMKSSFDWLARAALVVVGDNDVVVSASIHNSPVFALVMSAVFVALSL
eukprot:TRINITY_DN4274_c0_g2_i1.p1 TRINITY_DN4274_c0_g2~~TRINITY_DN4274_c0_g2_i1.p1  ORF type:complete len:658 (+),score=87.97 TRINITY_DN4274_c0_g2_i1:51-1976(+)